MPGSWHGNNMFISSHIPQPLIKLPTGIYLWVRDILEMNVVLFCLCNWKILQLPWEPILRTPLRICSLVLVAPRVAVSVVGSPGKGQEQTPSLPHPWTGEHWPCSLLALPYACLKQDKTECKQDQQLTAKGTGVWAHCILS